MKDTVKEGATPHASPPDDAREIRRHILLAFEANEREAREKSKRVLRDFGLFALITVLLGSAWKYYAHQRELATADWLRESVAIHDPWQRFSKLRLEQRPSLNDDQIKYVDEQSAAALEDALSEHSAAALDHIERWEGSYAELVDKYPRDPKQRQEQLSALRVVWPDIQELRPVDRVVLVHLARQCHLQSAEPPIESETVLGCLRYSAKVLNADNELSRLLATAHLPQPLTAAP